MANDVTGHGVLRAVLPFSLLIALALAGCREYADRTPRPGPPTARYPAAVADPPPTGRLAGRVVWAGDRPAVAPVHGLIDTPDGPRWGEVPNPFAPRIDDRGGVGGVAVWLTPVDGPRWKAWPYPPLVLEHTGDDLRSVQPGVPPRLGFARVGDAVELVTRGKRFQSLRGRGAAFFTLAFPDPDLPRRRTLDTPGVVEFTSAAGDFWNAVDVIVCGHPYHTATDPAGRFELTGVPPGEYTLTARVRNWGLTGRDRDPETGKTVRLSFAEAVRVTRAVSIPPAGAIELEVTAHEFGP